MGCNKRPFDSPDAAQKSLRLWQRRARRSAFDEGHVYKCPECVGTFHVGRKHERENRAGRKLGDKGRPFVPAMDVDDLDAIFEAQIRRVKSNLKQAVHRHEVRKTQHDRVHEGPALLTRHLDCAGDSIDVITLD